MLLKGKTALITGASSGIGRAMALMFAEHGANVCLCARRAQELAQLTNDINAKGGKAIYYAGDVGLEDTHLRLIDQIKQEFGHLDIAINNAGKVGPVQPLIDFSVEEWLHVQQINATAAFLGAKHQIPAMLDSGGGSIVLISSFVGSSVALPGMSSYASAKASLLALAKSITAEYATQQIRANVILPGGVHTDMAGDAQQREWAAGLHAMKRLAEPSEIASAALFLASDLASFVTGTSLYVDGGNSAVK